MIAPFKFTLLQLKFADKTFVMQSIISAFKKLLAVVLLQICLCSTSIAQDNSIYILQEKLEDVKRGVVEMEAKLPVHVNYNIALEAYLARLKAFKQADLKSKLDTLAKQGETAKGTEFENVIGELSKLRFDFPLVFRTDPAVSAYAKEVTNSFQQRIDNILAPLQKYIEFYSLNEEGVNLGQLIKDAVTDINKIMVTLGEDGLAQNLVKETTDEIGNNKGKKENLEKDIKAKREEKLAILASMGAKDQINKLAIQLGLPLFCMTVVLLFIGPYLSKKINKNATEEENRDSNEHISKVMLEVITVLLITMTILILGLAKILEPNVLGTLLGAIAGYILNRNRTDINPTTPAPGLPPKKLAE